MPGPDIEHLGVVGAGQMGRGIAQLAAAHGLTVTLVDAGRDVAERGRATIAAQMAKLVEKKKISAEERDATLARIHPADLYGGELEAVDFAIDTTAKASLTSQRSTSDAFHFARPSAFSIAPAGAVVNHSGACAWPA